MASSVRLPSRGQALVVASAVGYVRDNDIATRSLCTVGEGNVIVEDCNESTDEYWIRKGAVVASATIVPKSAFNYEDPPGDEEPQGKNGERVCDEARSSKPDAPPDKDVGETADFSESDLSVDQKTLSRSELNGFYDMFVESSMKPGRTKMLYFKVDTGNSPPIKQQPYRVSLTEGEMMEAEI
ncbi:hypothetical protein PInf_004541 [Phytophthora infestans]|nr:hypothetical protein PInf_004541 [Phytophthora infestans]